MIPADLRLLIDNFKTHKQTYMGQSYNETQLRLDFLNKFIELLEWDVYNKKNDDETYREVIHEDKLTIAGQTKAPDYCIQLGGNRLYYIEAKKPSVNINTDPVPAFQVRNYGWHKKMPICLLTNFAEYAVYDTSYGPKRNDNASIARIFYCKYDELEQKNPRYPEVKTNWDYLYNLFSQSGIRKGSISRLNNANRRGTQEVDALFLQEIESWRENLAKNITKLNIDIKERELNYIVQKTIDRIIFLRICEDRGIEHTEMLKSIASGDAVYTGLLNYFKEADDRYNSGLFHFHAEKDVEEAPDTISEKVCISDKILKDIIKSLYAPAPYDFSLLPADILGSIYERFLGKVIRITQGHIAKIEEKPEVKKAGGVFYTPEYIVSYIVNNTIGQQLKRKTLTSLKNYRIVDPACGSGSFLINAYQFLLDWYKKQYSKDPVKYKKQCVQINNTEKGIEYKLTITERKRILTTHIYGVDIDSQAIEVTKLSLLLKALEGLNEQEIQKELFIERALPDLSRNIKCGNSLIANDFYVQGTLGLTEDEQIKINAFNWEKGFKTIFDDGGFDVIISNPPYVFTRNEGIKNIEKEYYNNKFKHQNYQLNTFTLFIEQGHNIIKSKGRFGFIVPNNWLTISSLKPFRDFIVSETNNLQIVNNLYKVFADANVDTSLVVFTKDKPNKVTLYKSDAPNNYELQSTIDYSDLLKTPIIQITKQDITLDITKKIEENAIELHRLATVSTGIKAYQKGKGKPTQTETIKKNRIFHSNVPKNNTYAKYLQGIDVKRNLLDWSGEYISYGDWLAEPRRSVNFETNRILVRQIPSKMPYMINAVYVEGYYINDINSMMKMTCKKNSKILFNR
jgi:type I restriction-modification system DNA methylase subunit